jgi:hypothetical protein
VSPFLKNQIQFMKKLILPLASLLSIVSIAQNVGIGTNTPTSRLQISGNLGFSADTNRLITVNDNSVGGFVPGASLTVRAASAFPGVTGNQGGSLVLQAGNGWSTNGQTYSGGDVFVRSGGNILDAWPGHYNGGNIIFQAGNGLNISNNSWTEQMRINYLGNVGIGIAAPASKLQVAGKTTTTDFQMTNGAADNFVLKSDATGNASWVNPNTLSTAETDPEVGANSANYLSKWNGTALISSAIFENAGNTGIGTATPATPLHVKGNDNILTIEEIAADNLGSGALLIFKGQTGANVSKTIYTGLVPSDGNSPHRNGSYEIRIPDRLNIFRNSVDVSALNMGLTLIGSTGYVGIGTDAPTAKLSVNGTANNSTGAWGVFSDERIKTVTNDFTDGLNVIEKINPVIFKYNSDAPFTTGKEQVGVVAQELEKIAPYMVSQQPVANYKDLREVSNQAYTFLLINSVKEQQRIIEGQNKRIETLEKENETLKNMQADIDILKAAVLKKQ